MDFNKRQNEYCDIPGFAASKGERIVRALQKLLEKIQYLEQNRTSEKSKSEPSCSSKDEDLTLTDVQYKLLLLQLQYVRSLFRKRYDSNSEVITAKTNEDKQKIDRYNARKSVPQDIGNELYSPEIPTESNFVVGLNLAKESSRSEHSPESVQITSNGSLPRFKHSPEKSTAAYQKAFSSSSKPHYHLKLDDVPFILGASSTASHSVVANVQNIIAMMKSHNKALCGPKPTASSCTAAITHSTNFPEKTSTGENSQDVTKLLNDLTRDLSALAAKQQKLAESIDATQIEKHNPDVNSACSNQNHRKKNKTKHIENSGSRTHRSYSESEVKLNAEVKKMPKVKEKDFVKHSVHPKQSAYNVRPQTSNLSIMGRRKLLRSLQNFKKHLSAEDISWN